jgi:hypothetical protein
MLEIRFFKFESIFLSFMSFSRCKKLSDWAKLSRKIFRLINLSTTRNGFSLLSSCYESLFFVSFFFVEIRFLHENEQIQSKLPVFIFVFLVFQFHAVKSLFLSFWLLFAIVETIKVKFFLSKICEELSAEKKSESPQILSFEIRLKESSSGQFVKDFSTSNQSFFIFYYAP